MFTDYLRCQQKPKCANTMCELLQIQDGGGELMNQCRGKRKLASRQANQRSHSVVVGHLYCSSVSSVLTIAVGNKRLSVYIMRRIKKHSNPHVTQHNPDEIHTKKHEIATHE